MDLTKLEKARVDAETPERLELLQKDGTPYPDDDGLGVPFLMVKGADCQAVREASRRMLGKVFSKDDVEEEDAIVAALDPAVRLPRAMAAVAEWGGIGEGGVALPFTSEGLARVLQFEHHLGQVERKMREHGRPFVKPSLVS